jgi:hypothetical protein
MAREATRINTLFLDEQKVKRTTLADAPGQAGGLPEVNNRIQVIEEILALHAVTP